MNRSHGQPVRGKVTTLGPTGTDAQAEAARHFAEVFLEGSFESAMRAAFRTGTHALVAAGFVERSGERVTDLWVNLHFRHLARMRIVGVWESPTKPMCVATGPSLSGLTDARADVPSNAPSVARSVALHPATEVFTERFTPQAERQYVDAKPLAVQRVVDGMADSCVGSLDVVERHPTLTVCEVLRPSMVWILYRPFPQRELPHP
ncbi:MULTISPECIES: hypothetical protein [unclassified Streptomyces]|uniref:hypothetical protein n=1 Tax=unclassified Streptomyces TaxID=2593676 RepID=UPI0016613E33|nr:MULTISPECIES: hypothetical protein [unclassified Streptomyces]MBD0710666.1 hypothetical protein [Streptomyces sp. CBMA291]MBD0715513.1 hypothetical protein [Streptomyces sp. CBMA370]